MTEFSEDAIQLMCGLFFFGEGTVKSHPPHAMYNSKSSAFQELLDAKLITKEPFNKFDIWLYKPTPKMAKEAEKHKEQYWKRSPIFGSGS